MEVRVADILAIAMSILLFALVVGFASSSARSVDSVVERQQEEEDSVARLTEYAKLAKYDDETISGAELISCIRRYASGLSKDYSIVLLMYVNPTTQLNWYIYAEDPEDQSYIQRKFPEYNPITGEQLPLPTTEEFEAFISPVVKYRAHIVYDENNVAVKLVFAKERSILYG